jgi:hypothetical protein
MSDFTPTLKQFYTIDTLEDQGPLEWIITLTKEPWTGIQYKPTRLKFKEGEPEEFSLKASLEYEIVFVPEHFKTQSFTDEQKKELDKLIGDIVVELILEDFSVDDQ